MATWLGTKIFLHRLRRVAESYAYGKLLDVGCGTKPHRDLFAQYVDAHLGLDHPGSQHDKSNMDIFATACALPIQEGTFETILCTAVLEHLENPMEVLFELFRVLKPGGVLILSTPLIWHVHEAPRDFYRYTEYGLQYLLSGSGFKILELQPLSRFVVTFAIELCYYLHRFRCRPFIWLLTGLQFVIQWTAYKLNHWDRSYGFTWAYLLAARKPT
jgi:SAM-dependent methyltransferase